MKVLSLFNGISCWRPAFERAGIEVEKGINFETDKYANQVAQYNYPNDEYNGDVFQGDFTQYKEFDVLVGGSPCTHWSIAKQGRETTSSGIGWDLFMQYKRALVESGCRWFLYENNYSIHKDIRVAITAELGVEPIMINSALVSAQNRKRCYWTNIAGVTQPEDKGILLKDILESGVPYSEKSYTLTASYDGAVIWNSLERKQRTMIAEPVTTRLKDKSGALRATYYKCGNGRNLTENIINGRGYEGVIEPVAVALRTYPRVPNGEPRVKRPEIRNDEKANCLTSVQSDSMVCEPIRIGQYGKGGQGQRIYSVQGKSICLSANSGGKGDKTGLYYIDLPDGDYIIRKLTPIECERLQTLPDNYTAGISNTQRYKCIGNGWTVDTIAHILSFLQS